MDDKSTHPVWSKRWTFVLAATGSAVGLGNIWKFPYITGEHGGGAFVLVYLLCIAAVGFPILMAEVLLGRMGRQSPIGTMRQLAGAAKAHRAWILVGVMGVIAGFLILSFYSVIAGWVLAYILKAVGGNFTGASAEQVGADFNALLHSPGLLLFWHTLFMLLTCGVVARGVNKGLEAAIRLIMPALFVLLVILLGYSMTSGAFAESFAYLFTFDFSKLNPEAVIVALGHAFFTLSLGMGAMMVYGAYMPSDLPIVKTAFIVALLDTLVALAAGLVVFSIVFANQLDPGAGPGLMFVTLPLALGNIPGGWLFSVVFFVLVLCAAWSSSISLVEPAVAWLEERKGFSRLKATGMIGIICWILGIGTVLSFSVWENMKWFDKTFFDLLDFVASNILLPLGGAAIALFASWVIPWRQVREQLSLPPGSVWESSVKILLRFIAPLAVLAVFAHAMGWI